MSFDPTVNPVDYKVKPYQGATRDYWQERRVFFTTSYLLFQNAGRSIARALRMLAGWVGAVIVLGNRSKPELPPADIILYYTTSKPHSQPAMEQLSERLARRGKRVLLISGLKGMESVVCDAGGPVQRHSIANFRKLYGFGVGRLTGIKTLAAAAANSAALWRVLRRADASIYRQIFRNPLSVLVDILHSLHNMEVANWIIRQARPRMVLINNVTSPMMAEMHACPAADGVIKVYFCNEFAASHTLPAFSDEMWVWNEDMLNDFRGKIWPDKAIRYEVIGCGEVDYSEQAIDHHPPEELELHQALAGQRVLLYLSEYVPSTVVTNAEVYTREQLAWLTEAARQCPEWKIIYKSRPRHHGELEPGMEELAKLPNVIIPETEINLRNFLQWKDLPLVIANESNGLYVAAGLKKMPVRMMVPSRCIPHPELDSFAVFVHQPEELVQLMKNFDRRYAEFLEQLASQEEKLFPSRGQVLDHLEQLCLRQL